MWETMLSVKVVNLGDLPAERRQSISETTDSCVSRTKLWRKLWSALGFLLTLPDVLSTNWELISGKGLLSLHLCALSHVLYRSSITLTSRGVCGLFQYRFTASQHQGSKMMFKRTWPASPEIAECFVLSWFPSPTSPPSPPPPPPIPLEESSSWSLLGFRLREIFWQSSTCNK